LLVVSHDGQTLSRQMRITRLGQGVDATHRLNEEAMQRTLSVLADYKKEMGELGVERARLVATSAVRDAENSETFLNAATAIVGVQAELLSGLEEGRLSCAGATADLPSISGDDILADIGGGSTEIALKRDGNVEAISLDIGCVRLTERIFHNDPPTPAQIADAEGVVAIALIEAVKVVPALGHINATHRFLGLAGTVSTLAMLDLGIEVYDRDQVHHFVLSREAVDRLSGELLDEPTVRRAARPGMEEGRAHVIAAGALILRAVMTGFGLDECLVSEADILDGLVASIDAPR
jgi:exopolyphosphatase/guanosine-5'-triphosphate,3'-diphosphate pyrophosphatase